MPSVISFLFFLAILHTYQLKVFDYLHASSNSDSRLSIYLKFDSIFYSTFSILFAFQVLLIILFYQVFFLFWFNQSTKILILYSKFSISSQAPELFFLAHFRKKDLKLNHIFFEVFHTQKISF